MAHKMFFRKQAYFQDLRVLNIQECNRIQMWPARAAKWAEGHVQNT
jgi:hypothetical protein